MIKIMDCKEIAEKIDMSPGAIRTFLCRQEFAQYATYQKRFTTKGCVCYRVTYAFLRELKEFLEKKRLLDGSRKVKRWMNEYCRIL